MKALTIEEIVKNAQNNEPIYFVALVDDTDGLFPVKAYYFPVVVYEINSDEVVCFQMFNRWVNGLVYLVEDYGTKWVAYKNKEQAECKGELVELPRIIHPNELEWFVQYQYHSGIINDEIFYSSEEAEQKLKELICKNFI